nr:hypothetical protein [Frisingicoccus sp.]
MQWDKDDSFAVEILKIIGLVIMFILICNFNMSCSRSDSRSERNMVYIQEGYCYDQYTKIIYIETYTGYYSTETSYSPYYDQDGNLCKYDESTGEWMPIKEKT